MTRRNTPKKFRDKLNYAALLGNILSGAALPYALYGGGACASEILNFFEENGLPLPRVIFDRNPAAKELHGIALMKPLKENLNGISTIMLATEVWQDSMKRDIAAVFGQDIRVLDILSVNREARKLISKKPAALTGQLSRESLNIAVRCDGGMGDVINVNAWLKQFRKLFICPIRIDVFCRSKAEGRAIFENCGFVHRVFAERSYMKRQENYDLAIIATWSVLVGHFNEKRAAQFDRRIVDFVAKLKEFWNENDRYLRFENLHMLMRLCVYRGIDRWKLLGGAGIFPFDKNSRPFLPISDSALACVKQYGLDKRPYIVIGSGCNATFNFKKAPVRSWPADKWDQLVRLVKAKYPSLAIVQIGSGQTVKHIQGVDIDIAGKTSLEEMKVVLKNAAFLIDYDTGSIHFNYAMGRRSAVLFGSSFIEFIGYDQNINISAKVCPECIWLLSDYPEHCALEQDPPKCMDSISPEMVMGQIAPVILSLSKNCLHERETSTGSYRDLEKRLAVVLGAGGKSVKRLAIFGNNFIGIIPNAIQNGFSTTFFTVRPEEALKKFGVFQQEGVSIEFGSPVNMPVESGSFDAILFQAHQSWDAAKISAVKCEAARVLKPEGILILLENAQRKTASITIFQNREEALLHASAIDTGEAA